MKLLKKILKWISFFSLGLMGMIFALPFLIPLKPTPHYSEPSLRFPNSIIEQFNNVYVHYRIFEPNIPKKGNILMIHGFAGSTFSWRKNIDTLTQNGYQVVCIDLPCFGLSERKLDWNHSSENRAKLAWELTQKVAPNEPWNLVGHSMGASVILTMGQLQPEKTLSLVCVDGLFVNPRVNAINRFLVNTIFIQRISEILLQRYFTKPEKFKQILASAYGQTPEEEAVSGYLKPFMVTNAAKGILATVSSYSTFSLDYAKVQNKMFLIWGETDTWIPLQNALNWKKKYPDVPLYILKNAGHCPMETHPKEFNTLLLKIIQKQQ